MEEHLSCIDEVIRRNRALIRAAHLDRDDVYQELAIRLIRCVENFDPDKGQLKKYIKAQLQCELLNCKGSRQQYGLTHTPHDLRGAVISLNTCGDLLDMRAMAA